MVFTCPLAPQKKAFSDSSTQGHLHEEAFGAQNLEGSCRLQVSLPMPARHLCAILILKNRVQCFRLTLGTE